MVQKNNLTKFVPSQPSVSTPSDLRQASAVRKTAFATRVPILTAAWIAKIANASIMLFAFAAAERGVAQATLETSELRASKGRCASRVSIALTGKSPDAELLAAESPQSLIANIIKKPEFTEYFARYFNAKANDSLGATSIEDSSYHLAKHVLTANEPWKNVFIGPYELTATGTGSAQTVNVVANPNGVGYFRNKAWLDRYSGNEPAGTKLATIYRMMNNVLGLTLVASTNAPGADVSATGRRAPACASCHYQGWYALDINVEILNKKVVPEGTTIAYTPAIGQPLPGGPKSVLGGKMVSDDKGFITAMVESDAFAFNACRLAFGFLYGRNENQCEATLFDACMDAFQKSGMIQNAISAIATDPSFCN